MNHSFNLFENKLTGSVSHDVTDDSHGRLGRVDVSVTDHKLLQDIVLDGSSQLLLINALLFGGDDEVGEYRQYSTIHSHGYRYLVQRNSVKEDLHVFYGIDGYSGHTYITCRMRFMTKNSNKPSTRGLVLS